MRTKLKRGFIGIRAKTCNNSNFPSKTGHFVEGANDRSSKASKVIYTLKRRKLLFETIYTWVLNVLPWLAFQCQHNHPMVTTFKTTKNMTHIREFHRAMATERLFGWEQIIKEKRALTVFPTKKYEIQSC